MYSTLRPFVFYLFLCGALSEVKLKRRSESCAGGQQMVIKSASLVGINNTKTY